MLQLTPEEINVIFRYTTNGNPAKTFTIEPDIYNVWAAVAVVELKHEHGEYIAIRFCFERDETKPSAPGYFGGDSSLHFRGSLSSPLYSVGGRWYVDDTGRKYFV